MEMIRYENNNIEQLKNLVSETGFYENYTNMLTEKTRLTYTSSIKQFFGVSDINTITIETMQSVTPQMVNAWAHKLLSAGYEKSSINGKLTALHSFYNFLCRRSVGIMTYNPFSTSEGAIRFKNTSKNYSDKRALTSDEVADLFNSVDIYNVEGLDKTIAYRDLLILQILATTGMRRGELCKIKLGDIRVQQGMYAVEVLGKGGKTRMCVIAPQVMETLNEYLSLREINSGSAVNTGLPLIISHSYNADSTKFVNESTIYRVVKKYAVRSGIDANDVSPHNLRHTFATVAYSDLDVNKDDLQQLMGHSSSATTGRYIHAVEQLEKSPALKLASMYGKVDN